jgi:hypothetical protein
MRAKTKPPRLTVVEPAANPFEPPVTEPTRPLGSAGRRLWVDVMASYDIADIGGRELLLLACEALDRAGEIGQQIARDGPIIATRAGPKEHPGLRSELANRAFAARSLQRLGLDIEPVGRMGRPTGPRV